MFRVVDRVASNAARKLLQGSSGTQLVACKRWKVLSLDNINPHVKKMEYAVRGPIVIRAGEIEQELKKVIWTLKRARSEFCPSVTLANLYYSRTAMLLHVVHVLPKGLLGRTYT